jgi:hypothetical protein
MSAATMASASVQPLDTVFSPSALMRASTRLSSVVWFSPTAQAPVLAAIVERDMPAGRKRERELLLAQLLPENGRRDGPQVADYRMDLAAFLQAQGGLSLNETALAAGVLQPTLRGWQRMAAIQRLLADRRFEADLVRQRATEHEAGSEA